jgi:hypothetical protein
MKYGLSGAFGGKGMLAFTGGIDGFICPFMIFVVSFAIF